MQGRQGGATPMSSDGSITQWLRQVQAGKDEAAAKALYDCYYQKLVHLARQKLQGTRRGVADEEDVAHSALKSFLEGATAGQFARLMDRDDLWQILVVLTARKAVNLIHHE